MMLKRRFKDNMHSSSLISNQSRLADQKVADEIFQEAKIDKAYNVLNVMEKIYIEEDTFAELVIST